MVLNLLRVEEINPEYMLERSFYQFQNNTAMPLKQQSELSSLWRIVTASAHSKPCCLVIPFAPNYLYSAALALSRYLFCFKFAVVDTPQIFLQASVTSAPNLIAEPSANIATLISPPPLPHSHIHTEVRALEAKRDAIVIKNEESVTNYYRIRQQLSKLGKELQSYIVRPIYCVPFLQPGRLVKVEIEDMDFGWGCIINYQKKRNQKVCAQ